MAEPEIVIASTTQTAEELAQAFEGGDVEEVLPEPSRKEKASDEANSKGKPEPNRTSEGEEDHGRIPRGAQRRIAQLTARLRAAEEKLSRAAEPKPVPSRNAITEDVATRAALRDTTGDTRPQVDSGNQSYQQRAAAMRARVKDWDETFKAVEGIQVPDAVLEEIRKLENGPEVGYFLAKNPELIGHLAREPQLAVQRVRQMAHDLYFGSMPGTAQLRQRVNELHAQQSDAKQIAEGWGRFPMSRHVANAIQQALSTEENGPLVAIHLGRHPELAAEFARMTPLQVYGKVVRLATELGAKAPAARPVSRAPAPVKPVSSSSPVSRPLDDPDISTDEFVRRRNAQETEKRRRRY